MLVNLQMSAYTGTGPIVLANNPVFSQGIVTNPPILHLFSGLAGDTPETYTIPTDAKILHIIAVGGGGGGDRGTNSGGSALTGGAGGGGGAAVEAMLVPSDFAGGVFPTNLYLSADQVGVPTSYHGAGGSASTSPWPVNGVAGADTNISVHADLSAPFLTAKAGLAPVADSGNGGAAGDINNTKLIFGTATGLLTGRYYIYAGAKGGDGTATGSAFAYNPVSIAGTGGGSHLWGRTTPPARYPATPNSALYYGGGGSGGNPGKNSGETAGGGNGGPGAVQITAYFA